MAILIKEAILFNISAKTYEIALHVLCFASDEWIEDKKEEISLIVILLESLLQEGNIQKFLKESSLS